MSGFGFRITSREADQPQVTQLRPEDLPEEKRKKIASTRKVIEAIKRSLVNLPAAVELDASLNDSDNDTQRAISPATGFWSSLIQRCRNFFLKPVLEYSHLDTEFIITELQDESIPLPQEVEASETAPNHAGKAILLSEPPDNSLGFTFRFGDATSIDTQAPRPRNL